MKSIIDTFTNFKVGFAVERELFEIGDMYEGGRHPRVLVLRTEKHQILYIPSEGVFTRGPLVGKVIYAGRSTVSSELINRAMEHCNNRPQSW